MDRVRISVEHDDGHVDEVVLRPLALVAAERHFKGNVPAIEGTLWAAHYLLKPDKTFADWLEGIAGVKEETVPPSSATPAAASPSSQ
jgi:hypothetical protein